MTNLTALQGSKLLARTARIVSGLVLLAFVTSHLLNASLGIISLEAMDNARPYLTGVWNAPGLAQALFLSLIAHFVLGLWSVFQRPTLKTNAQDMVQLVTALIVVPLMATHVIGIAMVSQYGLHFDYQMTIRLMWVDAPAIGLLQVIVVTVVWLHGCSGLLTWLRAMEGARTIILWIYPITIAIPVAALLGFSEAGRHALEDAAPLAGEPAVVATEQEAPSSGSQDSDVTEETPPAVDFELIKSVTNWTIWGSLALAALTLLARAARIWMRPNTQVFVAREDVEMDPARSGLSLLDVFRASNQAHASLCQGRGRCGTCAVKVLSSEFPLQAPSEMELQTIAKKGLPDGTRLACQVIPDGGRVSVTPLYPADYTYQSLDDDTPAPGTPDAQSGTVTP